MAGQGSGLAVIGSVKERLAAWATEAADDADLDTVSAFIIYRLSLFADAECCAWAAVETLAKGVRKSVRTVQYRMRELEEAGLVRNTGRVHMTETERPRPVPIYQLAPEVEGLGKRAGRGATGADSAPVAAPTGAENEAYGCNRAAPVMKELKGTESFASLRAGAREPDYADFERVEAAYPQLGLGFTNRTAAWAAFQAVVLEGAEPAELAGCAERYAADPVLKTRQYGPVSLDKWLSEGRWRGWRASARQASAGMGAGLPLELTAAVVARLGAKWAAQLLEGAKWRVRARALVCASDRRAEKLLADMADWFSEQGIGVRGPAAAEPAEEGVE
jgi:hypothetical protein